MKNTFRFVQGSPQSLFLGELEKASVGCWEFVLRICGPEGLWGSFLGQGLTDLAEQAWLLLRDSTASVELSTGSPELRRKPLVQRTGKDA